MPAYVCAYVCAYVTLGPGRTGRKRVYVSRGQGHVGRALRFYSHRVMGGGVEAVEYQIAPREAETAVVAKMRRGSATWLCRVVGCVGDRGKPLLLRHRIFAQGSVSHATHGLILRTQPLTVYTGQLSLSFPPRPPPKFRAPVLVSPWSRHPYSLLDVLVRSNVLPRDQSACTGMARRPGDANPPAQSQPYHRALCRAKYCIASSCPKSCRRSATQSSL